MWYIVRRGEFVEVHVGVSVETVRVGQSGVVGFLSGPVFSVFCQVRCDVFCELGWVAMSMAMVVGWDLLRFVRVGYGFIVLHLV